VPAEPDEVAAFEVRRERIAARISDHLSKGRVTTWPSEHRSYGPWVPSTSGSLA
jgi:hypothetical protein